MKKIFLCHSLPVLFGLAVLTLAVPETGFGQTPSPTPDSDSNRRGVWQAELPGGEYIVMLSAITSISMHEYVVDGAAKVTEVNINTFGPMKARFYFIGPNIPELPGGVGQSGVNLLEEKVTAAMERSGGETVAEQVVKNYPVATHAGTIEFRLSSLESLQKLFNSVEKSWLNKKAGKFKP